MMPDEMRVQKECNSQLVSILQEMDQILADYANEVVKQYPVATKQLTILLGSILKASESTTAIVHLGKIGVSDEMNVLLRTLVELIINTCYLQSSSDEEIERYIRFDAIANHTAMEDFKRANKGRNQFAALSKKLEKCAFYAGFRISGIGWVSAVLATEAGM